MGQTNFPDGLTVGNADGTATFNLGATTVYATGAELNALNAAGLSATELGYLNTTTPGTAVASKALVLGASKDIDIIDFQATSGIKIAGVAVTSSAAELNYVATSTPGTAVASKALVLGPAKDIDILDIQATSGLRIAGVAVTPTAAEFNYVDGAAGAVLAFTASGKMVAAGTVIVPTGASGTPFTTGLTTVEYVSASVYNAGTPLLGFQSVNASHSGGTVTLIGVMQSGVVSDAQGTATWIAVGT